MNNYLVDSNIIIYFFEGNKKAGNLFLKNEFSISAITQIEILGYWILSKIARASANDFLATLTIIQTNPFICEFAAKLRHTYNLKTPDAVIAATAKYLGFPLLTADEKLFKIKEVQIIEFIK